MPKRVFIIHGWGGNPESNWFPWLENELEKKGFKVEVPTMPNTDFPELKEWLPYLQKLVGKVDEETIFVGHSLGAITILRLLEALPKGEKAGGAIFAAGFPGPLEFKELDNFFVKPLDYEKIKESVKKIIAITSDNDPYVPLKNGELLKEKLGAELIVISGAGHLNEGDGFMRLPIVLDLILKMAKN